MSEGYEREQQNNALLNSLSSKVSALRSVTIDIHDHARDQDMIENSVRLPKATTLPGCNGILALQNEAFSSFSTTLKGSASRLTRMAKQGDTTAVLKVAGIVIAAGTAIYIILGWIF